MPEIIPFRGFRYNQSKVDIHDVVAPPYDVIPPEQQERLYDRSPYNVVRLILGREADRYASSAATLKQWISEAILMRDPNPAFYVLHQEFEGDDGKPITRKGFVALCRLEEFEKKIVLPHEKTLAKPKEDRFKLFKATNSNFSQIFSFYSDPEKKIDRMLNGVAKTKPAIDVSYDDVRNSVWTVTDNEVIQNIRAAIAEKQVLIADGHHRYETALAYRDWMRSNAAHHTGREPYNYVMMFFTNVDDEGLVIYPTHRLIHSLPLFDRGKFLESVERFFIVREYKDEEAIMIALASSSVPSFGLLMGGDSTVYLLSLKPTTLPTEIVRDPLPPEVRELDVTILHSLILKDLLGISMEAQEQKRNLNYVRDAQEAYQSVLKGHAQLAFVMNATKIHQVRSVARAGFTMPQKSTYFYPKLVSGLVMNVMDDEGSGRGNK